MSFQYSLFISYRRNDGDKNFVKKLTNILHTEAQKVTNKMSPFFDIETIKWGDEFDDRIYDGIVSCYFFIPFYHNTYLHIDSLWCAKELYRAIEVEKKLREASPQYRFILPVIDRGKACDFPDCIGRKNAKDFNQFKHLIKSGKTSKALEEFITGIHDIFLENYRLIENTAIHFADLCSTIPIPTDEEIRNWVKIQKGIMNEQEKAHLPTLKKPSIS